MREERVGTAAVALGVCLSAGLGLAGAGLAGLIGQSAGSTFTAYLLGFGVLLPVAAWFALRIPVAARDQPAGGYGAVALGVGSGLVALLCAMRLADLGDVPGEAVSAVDSSAGCWRLLPFGGCPADWIPRPAAACSTAGTPMRPRVAWRCWSRC